MLKRKESFKILHEHFRELAENSFFFSYINVRFVKSRKRRRKTKTKLKKKHKKKPDKIFDAKKQKKKRAKENVNEAVSFIQNRIVMFGKDW